MDKREFYDRLISAGDRARALALEFVSDPLPEEVRFTFCSGGSKKNWQDPEEPIQFLGGRFLFPHELRKLDFRKAASLLWVDGKVPAWVQLTVDDYDHASTEVAVHLSTRLMIADEKALPSDPGTRDDSIVPFRLRGPALPEDWSRDSGKIALCRGFLTGKS